MNSNFCTEWNGPWSLPESVVGVQMAVSQGSHQPQRIHIHDEVPARHLSCNSKSQHRTHGAFNAFRDAALRIRWKRVVL